MPQKRSTEPTFETIELDQLTGVAGGKLTKAQIEALKAPIREKAKRNLKGAMTPEQKQDFINRGMLPNPAKPGRGPLPPSFTPNPDLFRVIPPFN